MMRKSQRSLERNAQWGGILFEVGFLLLCFYVFMSCLTIGQEISERNCNVFNSSKKQTKKSLISALATKKCLKY